MLVAEMTCESLDATMLGEVVKKIRKRKGMTQTDLAIAARLSLSIIQKIEKAGNGTRPTHRAIAEALGLTLEQFDRMVEIETETIPVVLPRYAYEHAEAEAVKSKVTPLEWILKRMGLSSRITAESATTGGAGAKRRKSPAAQHLQPHVKGLQK